MRSSHFHGRLKRQFRIPLPSIKRKSPASLLKIFTRLRKCANGIKTESKNDDR